MQAEAAAILSSNSTHLIEFGEPISDESLQRYWDSSWQRQRTWMKLLSSKIHEQARSVSQFENLLTVLEEIFVSEILTRTFTAILIAGDQRLQLTSAEPIARNVYRGHLQARQHALEILVNAPQMTTEQCAQVDRLRRKVERWTDLLLGPLVLRYNVGEFCFSESRAKDFGSEHRTDTKLQTTDAVWSLVLVGLRLAFPQTRQLPPEREQLHNQVVESVLACFPSQAFRAEGPFKSANLGRLARSSSIDEKAHTDFVLGNLPAIQIKPKPLPNRKPSNAIISFAELRRLTDGLNEL
jgi:hypothetical protein